MTRVYLVRHAKSVGNVIRIFQGRCNLGLSDEGKAQLPQLAEWFRYVHLDAIYASPLLRTMQTAEAVNNYHKLPIQTDDGLREIFAGEWEGQKFSELPTLFPEEWYRWTQDNANFVAPNGESVVQVYERMSETIDRIARENDGKDIAIVSHGCALRCYQCHALGIPISEIDKILIARNASVSCVIYDGDEIRVEFYDDHSFLSDLGERVNYV